MDLLKLFSLILFLFLGFAIGRYGDKWGGQLNAPHHWIYGLILILIGIFYFDNHLGKLSISFGVGHFISDLDDFLNGKFWGKDKKHKWEFWSIK